MVKIGEMIRVKSNLSGHNYIIGNIYKLVYWGRNQYKAIDLNTKVIGNYITEDEFFVVYMKEGQIEKISQIEKALNDIQKKKRFLKEKGLQQSDMKTYHFSMLLSIANADLNEKTKMENMQKYISDEM
jgi:hypothetical protein